MRASSAALRDRHHRTPSRSARASPRADPRRGWQHPLGSWERAAAPSAPSRSCIGEQRPTLWPHQRPGLATQPTRGGVGLELSQQRLLYEWLEAPKGLQDVADATPVRKHSHT